VPYDTALADRIRELLLLEPDVVEKKMFGGVAFLIGGHIAVGVSSGGGLLLRCEDQDWEDLLARPHVGPFVMRGRELRGWLRVAAEGVSDDQDLRAWVGQGTDMARSLPPK
jgi:hypothetical protein